MTNLKQQFDQYAHDLDEKASQLRQGTQIIKAGGLASTLLGGFGLLSTGVGALPVGIGVCVYGFGLLREKSTTGRLQPLPWSQESGSSMAASAIQQDVEQFDFRITDYDHLSLEDKCDYTLFTVMAPVLTPLLENATPIEQERLLTNARRTLVKYHSDLVLDPEPMASAQYGSLTAARGAFAKNLPEAMQKQIQPEVLEAATERRDLSVEDIPTLEAQSETTSQPSVDSSWRGSITVPSVRVAETPTTPQQAEPTQSANSALFANGRISPDLLAKPMHERADIILRLLKQEGCDIEQYLDDQILGTTGTQRSGKTTILMCLSILQMAMGKEVHYVTVDDDLYPVGFKSATAGLKAGKEAYKSFFTILQGLKKGQHKNEIFFLDECTKAVNQLGESSKESLWSGLLTGFLKTGGSVRMVTHGNTSAAQGIPNGYAAQAKDEATFLKALRKREDGTGKYQGSGKYPSGKYHLLQAVGTSYEQTDTTFQLPKWLQFDKSEDGNPCYVLSLLRFFPELDTRVTGATPKPFGSYHVTKGEPAVPAIDLSPVAEETKHPDEHEAQSEEVTLSDYVGVANKQVTRKELGDSGLTKEEACDAIARYMHKLPGKTRGKNSILTQAFSKKKAESLQYFINALIKEVAKDHPDCFVVDQVGSELKLTCNEILLSEKAYYPL